MIIEEIKNIKSGKRELRQFGLTVGIVLGLLGGLFFLRKKDYYSCFLIFSLAFLFLGSVAPILLKPIQKIWMALSIIIGWFITRIILIVLFYFVVTPTGILARLFGKDFLNLRFGRNINTYWIPRKKRKLERRDYEKQF